MPPHSPIARHHALTLLTAALLSACGGGGTIVSGTFACTNPVTGVCEPCAGAQVCIDPVTCAVVPCPGGDVLFGGSDGGGDAAGADGADSADAAADSDAGDAATADAADTDAASDVADSADASPDVTPGCDPGAKGCLDTATPALCVAGAWQAVAACPSGHACKQGACACAGHCEAIGQKACNTGAVAAVKTCELDASGCLRWAIPVACAPDEQCAGGLCSKKTVCSPACNAGQVCEGGVCKPDPNVCAPQCTSGQLCQGGQCVGTLSCGQMMACVEQYSQGPDDKLTAETCFQKGSKTAQQQYQARKDCIALSCKTLIDAGKVYEALLCVYAKCATEQTACTGAGSADCGALGGCLAGCGSSSVCVGACHAQASVLAVQKWYGLLLCGEQYCPGKQGDAFAQCTAQLCANAYEGCFGGAGQGGQGGYSCGQILQCAGGCGSSKDCAQQCKAKASPAGNSALLALLACNDKYCAGICNSGSAQQCGNCLNVYCAKEQAACQ